MNTRYIRVLYILAAAVPDLGCSVPIPDISCDVTSCDLLGTQEHVNISETSIHGTVLFSFNIGSDSMNFTTSPDDLRKYFKLQQGQTQVNLTLTQPLDLEVLNDAKRTIRAINVNVSCTEDPRRSVLIKVNILPVNEFTPTFIGAPYHVTVPEQTSPGTSVFSLVDKVKDNDAVDYNTITDFHIVPYLIPDFDGLTLFSINSATGVVSVNHELDSETLPRIFYILNVTATDNGGLKTTTWINVTIEDIDEYPPIFMIPDCTGISCTVAGYSASIDTCQLGPLSGLIPAYVFAKDGDVLNAPVAYSITQVEPLEAGSAVEINSTTGQLYTATNLTEIFNVTRNYGSGNAPQSITINFTILATEETENRFSTNVTVLIDVTIHDDVWLCETTSKSPTVSSTPTTNEQLSTQEDNTTYITLILEIVVPVCACVLVIIVAIIVLVICKGGKREQKYKMKNQSA